MSFVRSALVSVAVIGIVISGHAIAQTPAPAQSAPAATAAPTTTPQSSSSDKLGAKADEVKKWTTKEWRKAKAQWIKEKEKWADCSKQSKDQKLVGRKSWSFIASCMTSST